MNITYQASRSQVLNPDISPDDQESLSILKEMYPGLSEAQAKERLESITANADSAEVAKRLRFTQVLSDVATVGTTALALGATTAALVPASVTVSVSATVAGVFAALLGVLKKRAS